MSGDVIGLDFGSESARGVRIGLQSGQVEAQAVHPYRHGVITGRLPDGTALEPGVVLQNAPDYVEAAETLLRSLGQDRTIAGIGLDFTASSPMPALADGTPLSVRHPGAPHAYVKLWKHAAAQGWADRISAQAEGDDALAECGGRLSGNSLTAKAAELAERAPALWAEASRFIEAGDWLVWQLVGQEARSLSFASFKAQYRPAMGYPDHLVPGLSARLASPRPLGTPAGRLTEAWRARTGIAGEAAVAVAVIDGHVIVPAVGAVEPGTLVGALGTSACFLLLDQDDRPLPRGIEGVARDATLPGLRCFEAGQAAFGDVLAWLARLVAPGVPLDTSLARLSEEAARLPPGGAGLVALDWWNGCRVPFGDAGLTGTFAGLTLQTTAADMFRALLEALCFGTRTVVDTFLEGGAPIHRVLMTSGLSLNSPLLMQIMANTLGRPIQVPQQAHLTAVGAAIHGAVAAGVVPDFAGGAARFGAKHWHTYQPDLALKPRYDALYAAYRGLGSSPGLHGALHALKALPA